MKYVLFFGLLLINTCLFAHSPSSLEADKRMQVCIKIADYEIICIEITVESVRISESNIMTDGELDTKNGFLHLSDLPKSMNNVYLKIELDAFELKDGKEIYKYRVKNGQYLVKDGRTSIPIK